MQCFAANTAQLEKCNEEWLKLLDKLKGDEKMAEEKEYVGVAKGDDGLIELLLDSNETVAGFLVTSIKKARKGHCDMPILNIR